MQRFTAASFKAQAAPETELFALRQRCRYAAAANDRRLGAAQAHLIQMQLHVLSDALFETHVARGDFAQAGNCRFVVAFDKRPRAPRKHAGSLGSKNDQGEAVSDFF